MLSIIDGALVSERWGRAVVLAQIDPKASVRALAASGYRLAEAIASGALRTSTDAKALAQRAGLIV